ncbi:MAG: tRNA lysidine(34) synthetase TilS [Phycisphaerae bacterium]|nr:tRNA lysidine(34) synthetase TilS [Phycisphaerae bacterium]
MTAEDLESRFAQDAERNGLVPRGTMVVAGVSGGADSVAMLHLLCSLNRREWGLKIHVAHLNHQLRGIEADKDAKFVRELAEGLLLDCTVGTADVRGRASQDGVSIEQAARRCRFEFLERVCLKSGVRLVVLAHHADDNAETILHRIVRGTGLRGLGGIRASRPIRPGSDVQVVRPMLSFRRSEIEEYVRDRGLSFRHDATNDADSYTRNRIRKDILPLLRDSINPQVAEALVRLGEQARDVDEYLTETAGRMLESIIVERDDRQIVLLSTSLARKPRLMKTQLIREAMLLLGVSEAEIGYSHLIAVAAMTDETEGSKAMDLPGGLRVVRKYDRLALQLVAEPVGETAAPAEMRVAAEGKTLLLSFGIELSVETISADQGVIAEHIRTAASRGQVSWEEWIDADQVHFPLIARLRRPGDRFLPLGMSELKKLSDFFIDEKIDADVRERTVLLCDRLGPIWVVPLRIDDRVRLTEATRRVMRLSARQLSTPRD